MELKNIQFVDFLILPFDSQMEYIQIFNVSDKANTGVNHLHLSEPLDFKMTFWEVKNVQSAKVEIMFTLDWLQYVETWNSEKVNEKLALGIFEAWQQSTWIKKTLQQLSDLELKKLGGKRNALFEEAGAARLNEFANYNQLIEFCGDAPHLWEQYKNLPYMFYLITVGRRIVLGEVNSEYLRLLNERSKNGY